MFFSQHIEKWPNSRWTANSFYVYALNLIWTQSIDWRIIWSEKRIVIWFFFIFFPFSFAPRTDSQYYRCLSLQYCYIISSLFFIDKHIFYLQLITKIIMISNLRKKMLDRHKISLDFVEDSQFFFDNNLVQFFLLNSLIS